MTNKRITFIGDLGGRPYKYFIKLLEVAGLSHDTFNILQTSDNDILLDYLNENPTEIIVGVGKEPSISLTNLKRSTKLDDIHGKPINLGNRTIIFIYHPSFLMSNSKKYVDIFIDDLRQIAQMVKNG